MLAHGRRLGSWKTFIFSCLQNHGDKMEAQINRMEARIEKIQEIIYKDIEELKNKQPMMNNIITEI